MASETSVVGCFLVSLRCTSMMKEIGKLQAEKEELEEGVATLQKKRQVFTRINSLNFSTEKLQWFSFLLSESIKRIPFENILLSEYPEGAS